MKLVFISIVLEVSSFGSLLPATALIAKSNALIGEPPYMQPPPFASEAEKSSFAET